jgi:hypothetical protein
LRRIENETLCELPPLVIAIGADPRHFDYFRAGVRALRAELTSAALDGPTL